MLGAERGVRGSVILLEGVAARQEAGGARSCSTTHQCVFVSHVTAVMAGERARVKNSDPILHNTHGFLGKPTVFNLALPNRDQMIDITKRLTKPGVIRVLCDAHPHMSAWMIVHDSPYYAVTDERGAFRIDGIPPGTLQGHDVARGLPAQGRSTRTGGRSTTSRARSRKEVTIAPKATATVDFELK